MVHLTLQEKKVLLFLSFLFLAGMTVAAWRQKTGRNFCLIEVISSKKEVKAVNVNTATREELIALPGIGEKTADGIVAGRPFISTEDLKRVKGITDKKLSLLKDLIIF